MTTQATGWGGLAAAYVAPDLRTRPYFVFSIFLILYGIVSDWFVMRRWNDPVASWLIGLRSVLADIPQASAVTEGKGNTDGPK